MGIAVPDSLLDKRSNLASATYTAIALVFFFGVGLAGGAAYKIYFENGAPLLADRGLAEPAAAPARAPALAARTPTSPETDAPDLARVEPSAPPALAPPPAPSPAEATKPHAPSASATTAAPPAPAPLAQAAPAAQPPEAPVPYAAVAPKPAAPSEHAEHAAPTKIAAVPPKKPPMAAKSHRAAKPEAVAPQSVALRPPPTALGNAVGPFRVQFGAFANEDNARRVQWAVEATGLKVDVTQAPGPSGHPLFFLRSPAYADYASALSAAQTVQHRVEHFVNAIPIEYAILPDHAAIEQQAQR